MNGHYIIARAWIGYSNTFPWFEELNPLPDNQVVEQLNRRSRDWLHQHKHLAKKRYRDEREALKAMVDNARRRRPTGLIRGLPSMSSYERARIEGWLARLDRPALVEEATRYGIQLALTNQELRAAILAVNEKEYLQMAYKRQKWEDEEYAQRVKDQFDIKKRVRGDRRETTTAARIARVAGWIDINVRRFIGGGLWPTSRLMLQWFETLDEANSILHLANLRFARPDWSEFPIKFSIISCSVLSANDLTMLEQRSQEMLDPDFKWTGTGFAQAIVGDFREVVRRRNDVLERDREQRPQLRPSPIQDVDQELTVADIVRQSGREWFTVNEFASMSRLSEDAVEGRIRRWAEKTVAPEATYKLMLPEASSGAARYMYRIHPIWPLLAKKAEISGKNPE